MSLELTEAEKCIIYKALWSESVKQLTHDCENESEEIHAKYLHKKVSEIQEKLESEDLAKSHDIGLMENYREGEGIEYEKEYIDW